MIVTTEEAVALYRTEKAAAQRRGVDLTTPQPIPERHRVRSPLPQAGEHWFRNDAFIVRLPRP